MKNYKSLLNPILFEYKGDAEDKTAIRARADKNPRIQSLKASLQRGKELVK
jgi:hypothetical protein